MTFDPIHRAERGRQAISADFGHDEWVDAIDFDTLDLFEIETCVIGQVYGATSAEQYNEIVERLTGDSDTESSLGFNTIVPGEFARLAEAWKIVLAPLREYA